MAFIPADSNDGGLNYWKEVLRTNKKVKANRRKKPEKQTKPKAQKRRRKKKETFRHLVKRAKRDQIRSNTQSTRESEEYKAWRKAVFEKCHFCCVKCGEKKELVAHHIKSWAEYPKLRFKVSNGVVLCKDCHALLHDWMWKSMEMRHLRSIMKEEF